MVARKSGASRFIPTRVGNTLSCLDRVTTNAVHPHASGEHLVVDAVAISRRGSSPREWGTRSRHQSQRLGSRFIPTRVGNTKHDQNASRYTTVHPHASGEHCTATTDTRQSRGSSPREWGTLHWWPANLRRSRFIPTRVGNTQRTDSFATESPVHPHASGEHAGMEFSEVSRRGSSPREWGTRASADSSFIGARFIPTRVGNTRFQLPATPHYPVHPHASGEHGCGMGDLHGVRGSSPREWGTRDAALVLADLDRFIPTRVGNTLKTTVPRC